MKDIIKFIEDNLSKKVLEDITTTVINAYKIGDIFILKSFAKTLNIDAHIEPKRIFYKIIQKLHPDRFSGIYTEFINAKAESDIEALKKIKNLLEIEKDVVKNKIERFEYTHSEKWTNEDIFKEDIDKYYENEEIFEDDFSGGFINAVKAEIFGNHNFYIEPSDLGQIDGILNLESYSLKDIDGIVHCRNLRVLNISENEISNIYDLSALTQLEELYANGNNISDITSLGDLNHLEILDLSNNDIDDISPLLNMEKLQFVNISKNPIADYSIKNKLEALGIIVLV